MKEAKLIIHIPSGTQIVDFGRVDGYALMLCGKLGGKWGSSDVATCPDCLDIINKEESYV